MFTKKILHVYSSWTAGGAEKTMLALAACLQEKGLKNYIACPRHSYMFAQAQKLGLEARRLHVKGSLDPFGIMQLWRIVATDKIDIIHAHQGKVFWPCIIMKLLSGNKLKVVFHRHAQLPHRFYSRSHYRIADRIIAISRVVADGLIEREKVPPEKLRVVYNGTDFTRFNRRVSGDAVRRHYGIDGALVIGTVAAMNRPRGKGQEYLLEAAQILRKRHPEARYLIVGTGPILDDLKSLARTLKVDDIVVFTGYQETVEDFIAAMNIFCFLSWDTEGFGQVMVEAQALGKPVIGTTIGGIPETLNPEVTGMLIPPRNSEMLAQALSVLLDDREKRHAMGEAAAAFVAGRFSLPAMADGIIEVYQSMYRDAEGI